MADAVRQRQWTLAAIAYYRAKVMLYELMVAEWQEELDRLRTGEPEPRAVTGSENDTQ